MTTVLTAGDRFVLPELFERAISAALPEHRLAFRAVVSAWPLEPFGDVDEVAEASGSPMELAEALDGVEVAVTHLAPFTAAMFESPEAAALRLVGIGRGGAVNVNLHAATAAGVVVTYAPGRNALAAGEFTLGMILAAARSIPTASAELHAGTWRGDLYAYDRSGTELCGSTVGLVGYGAVGSIVARILRAIGAHVLVADPYVEPHVAATDGVELVELDDLMRRSRIVSLHARLTEETRQLIDARRLGLLPHGAILVNTARGALLDHAPLPELLRSGALAGVALDVFEEPPGPTWPLLAEPDAVLTPHLARASQQTAVQAATIVAADVARFLTGEQPHFVANPGVFETHAFRRRWQP